MMKSTTDSTLTAITVALAALGSGIGQQLGALAHLDVQAAVCGVLSMAHWLVQTVFLLGAGVIERALS